MPRFCTNCGSPVEENLRFCPKCGTQLAAPSAPAPAAPAPTPTLAPPPTSAPPAAPAVAAAAGAVAPKSGSPILKIILAVVGVFVLLSALGIGACVYVAYKAKQKATEFADAARSAAKSIGTPEVHLEKGGEGSEAAAIATADVPLYPGSTTTEAVGALGAGIGGQEYETPDSLDKVVAFYKNKFGSKIDVEQEEGNTKFMLMTKNGMTIVTMTRDEDAGKTKINIARIGK